jgi:mono/diheme cytochrome c family protein
MRTRLTTLGLHSRPLVKAGVGGGLLALAALVGAGSLGQTPGVARAQARPDVDNAFEADPDAIQRGLELFNERCSFCHGTRGRGAKGPCLSCGRFLYRGGSNAQLFATISGGIPGGQMGAFAASMSGEDIWRIIAFLRDETRKRQAVGDEAVTQAK